MTALLLVVAYPALVDQLGLPGVVETVVSLARWPLLGGLLIFALAVIILLMWFYLTAYVVLMGAEVNAEIERQQHDETAA